MPTTTTTYMGLELPVVGSEPGPTWATDLNTALTTVDSHNHTTGQGVAIPTAGLNINADLNFNSYRAIGLKGVLMTPQSSTPTNSSGQLWTRTNGSYADLYYNAGLTTIPIVQNGVVLGNVNGFLGQYAASGGAYYDAATTTFAFYSTTSPVYDSSSRAKIRADDISSIGTLTYISCIQSISGSTPAGGWRMSSTSGDTFQLTLARSSVSTTYDTLLSGKTAIGSLTGQCGIGVNTASPAVVADFWLTNTVTTSTSFVMHRLSLKASTVSPAAGYGPSFQFFASLTDGGTPAINGQITGTWSSVSGSGSGGVSLWSVGSGSVNSTPDFQGDGQGRIGLLAAANAVSGIAVSVGGTMAPTSTYDLGTSGNKWRKLYLTNVASNLTPDTNNTYNLGTSSSAEYDQMWGQKGIFTGANYTPSAAADLVTRHRGNAILAWGRFNGLGGEVSAGANWNINGDATHAPTTNVFTVNLDVACSQNSAILVTNYDNGGASGSAVWASDTSITVYTASADDPFSIVVIGAPTSAP